MVKRSERSVLRSISKRLVVLIPAFNEEATIVDVISRIPTQIEGISEVVVVVVNDGSKDRTAELARSVGATLVQHPINLGVGAAFSTGIEKALALGADVIVNMDADGQFNPADIPALIEPILNQGFGFVSCTRFAEPNRVPTMPRVKLWGNRVMCRLVNVILGDTRFTDVACGFRAYSRDTALKLNLFGRFTYTQESLIDLASKGISMTEVSLSVRGVREFGKSRVASNLWHYALQSSAIILRAIRDRRPLAFFGLIALLFLGIGLGQLAFVAVWWWTYSQTSPWTMLIVLGGVSTVIGILCGVLALLADQVGRGRRIQEQLLYLMRRQVFNTEQGVDSSVDIDLARVLK